MDQQHLTPILQKVEALRLDHQKRIVNARKWWYVSLALVVVGLLFFGQGYKPTAIAFIVLGVVSFIIICFAKISKAQNRFKEEFKQEAYAEMIKSWYPDVIYNPAQHISKEEFIASELFSHHPDSYQGEDHFEGTTGQGLSYRFSEVHAENRNDNSHTTIFKGLFFVVELPNPVQGRVKILPDAAERTFGAFGKMLQEKIGGFFQKKTNMVYFEDYPDFEKKFVVYSDNEALARHLLTPQTAQYLVQLQEKDAKKPVCVSMINNQLFFAFSLEKDLLAPSVKQSVLEDAFIHQFTEEIVIGFKQLEIIEQLYSTMPLGTAPPSINASFHPQKAADKKTPLPKKRPSISYKKSSSKDNPFLL